jgi:hypothetical protein
MDWSVDAVEPAPGKSHTEAVAEASVWPSKYPSPQ